MQIASISCALLVVIISVTAQFDKKVGADVTDTAKTSTSVEHPTTPFPASTNLTTHITVSTTRNATTHETTTVNPTSKITTSSSFTTTNVVPPKPKSSTTEPTSTATPSSSSTPKPTDTSSTTNTKEPPTTSYPPVPQTTRHFDGLSFLGGMILTVCLLGIGVFSLKFYRACHEGNYRTL